MLSLPQYAKDINKEKRSREYGSVLSVRYSIWWLAASKHFWFNHAFAILNKRAHILLDSLSVRRVFDCTTDFFDFMGTMPHTNFPCAAVAYFHFIISFPFVIDSFQEIEKQVGLFLLNADYLARADNAISIKLLKNHIAVIPIDGNFFLNSIFSTTQSAVCIIWGL